MSFFLFGTFICLAHLNNRMLGLSLSVDTVYWCDNFCPSWPMILMTFLTKTLSTTWKKVGTDLVVQFISKQEAKGCKKVYFSFSQVEFIVHLIFMRCFFQENNIEINRWRFDIVALIFTFLIFRPISVQFPAKLLSWMSHRNSYYISKEGQDSDIDH